MKLREIVKKLREGPPPGPDKGINDTRLGLPSPTVRKPVTWQRPQATTSDDTGVQLNPENLTAGPLQRNPPFPYAKLGASPTSTPGYGRLSPSGTGLPEQSERMTQLLQTRR